MTLGVLGPVAYGLGLTDAVLYAPCPHKLMFEAKRQSRLCMFGTIFGSVCTGYISTFGPMSGLRTLSVAKYTMGWWPSKLCVILNLVIELGYGLIDCLVGGLILSAVNGGDMSVIIITWVVATFGMTWFHKFEL
jgi:purine-cytosine permease-like protein